MSSIWNICSKVLIIITVLHIFILHLFLVKIAFFNDRKEFLRTIGVGRIARNYSGLVLDNLSSKALCGPLLFGNQNFSDVTNRVLWEAKIPLILSTGRLAQTV